MRDPRGQSAQRRSFNFCCQVGVRLFHYRPCVNFHWSSVSHVYAEWRDRSAQRYLFNLNSEVKYDRPRHGQLGVWGLVPVRHVHLFWRFSENRLQSLICGPYSAGSFLVSPIRTQSLFRLKFAKYHHSFAPSTLSSNCFIHRKLIRWWFWPAYQNSWFFYVEYY